MKRILIILFFAISSSLFAQTVLTIEGQTFPCGKDIYHTTSTTLTFRNNAITGMDALDYSLWAGDEGVLSVNNNLDGAVITGNNISFSGTILTQHGIFVGYNVDQVIKYNYENRVPYGVVYKSGNPNMTNTSGEFSYNIVKNSNIAVRIKGINGVKVYNNTFYATTSSNGIIYISDNPDNGAQGSTGTKIYNNIFYTTVSKYNIYIETSSLTGFECDYNVYYSEAGSPIFNVGGESKTWSEWKALGYDAHSVVVNPNFNNTTEFVPTVRLDYGTDLGTTWQTGLTTTATWIVGSTPATTNQNGAWQVGARIYATKVYYVSPTGSNATGNGSIGSPWLTLNKAWSRVSAGDIIYVRGGTYAYAMMRETVLSGKSGTAGNLITISNYPGESPVINFSANTFTSQIIGIFLQNVNYLYFKGIRITSINQMHTGSDAQYGIILWDHVSNCTFEQIETDHIGGWGTKIGDFCNNNLFLNCDSHHNSDRCTTAGGNPPWGWSDGFQSNSWDNGTPGATSTGNIFRGCRAYWNSDDGWDLRRCDGVWTLENCWSFWNGYKPGERLGDPDYMVSGGDGDAYKMSGTFGSSTTDIRRILKNCLAFENKLTAYDGWMDNGYVGMKIYNCIAYNNKVAGFGFSDAAGASTTVFKNNISYANKAGNYFTSPAWWVHDHNNWDIPITVTDADFVSVNSAGMDGPRQADGSLPKLDFLKLSPTSKLIDAGIDVGLPFAGASPDLGAFETGMVTGISPKEIKNDFFRIYPNPVKDILYISAIRNDVKLISLKLYDIRGVELYKFTETGDCRLDFSRYRSGLYFLQIMSEGNLTIDKIVKY